MHIDIKGHIKNLLLPCLCFSLLAGFLSALAVTAFKLAAEFTVNLSTGIYSAVRENPIFLPLLLIGAAAIGLLSSYILSLSHSCKGGGIPTAVTAIRGIVSFKWLASITVLPFAALLTFLCGVPLGTEGPCVQMGTAIGDGVVSTLGSDKHRSWRRYIMTAGASSGFAVATSSPIAAILFSIEELHKHFSPLLLTVTSISVVTAQLTVEALALFGIGTIELFELQNIPTLDLHLVFAPLIIGLICGISSILFTRTYHLIDGIMRKTLKKCSTKILFPAIFAAISAVGFLISETLGSGHSLVESLLEAKGAWYMLILVFLIRAVGMMSANTASATGGVFLPTISFGAIIGSLCAQAMISIGLIGEEHYTLMVVLGITAFLAATSRIPLTACVFAVEALSGGGNILALILATTVSLMAVEVSGLEDFTDTLIESKMHSISKGKKPIAVSVPLTVAKDSFVIGKEIRDILWPNSCVVISFERASGNHESAAISESDVITVRYLTHTPSVSADEFKALVGEQSDEINVIMDPEYTSNQSAD